MSEQMYRWSPRLAPFRPEMMVGAATPLWGYFTGAAVAGMGWWWMTRWMRPTGIAAASWPLGRPLALATMSEAFVEPALEAAAEAVGGPVAEAFVADEPPVLPVGGEAAPISTVVLEAERIEDPDHAAELSLEPAPPAARARKPKADTEPKSKPH
jgi:hypothetical protein